MKNLLYVFASAFTLFATAAMAQPAAPRLVVAVSCSCNDAMGQAYFESMKNILSKDAHFQQIGWRESSERNAIRVHIISMPLESTDNSPRSALSIVFTHDGTLVHQFIETCTHIPIADCAMKVVHDLEEMEN